MTQNYPPFVVFPDLNCIIRMPSGTEYRGKLRQHPSNDENGEHWYEGYLRAQEKDAITADTTLTDRFNRDGLRPQYFHSESNVEPLRLKLNRVPRAKRNEKNEDTLVGEVWNHEGLWTVVSSPSSSASLHLAGNIVPSRHELSFSGSRIKQYQPKAPVTPEPEVIATQSRGRGRAARPS